MIPSGTRVTRDIRLYATKPGRRRTHRSREPARREDPSHKTQKYVIGQIDNRELDRAIANSR
jgi:hypothetical protein